MGTAFLTAINAAFRRIHLEDPNFDLAAKRFFYRPLHLYFFPENEYEGLLCATISAQNITRFFYAFFALIFLLNTNLFLETEIPVEQLPLYDLTNLWEPLHCL